MPSTATTWPNTLRSARRRMAGSAGARVTSPSVRGRPQRPGPRPALPAALAPLGEVRALRADRGVAAVAGIEPGLVGQPLEDLGLDLVDELGERRLVAEGVAHPAGEERVAREEVRVAGR